jgi:hypothetical protein
MALSMNRFTWKPWMTDICLIAVFVWFSLGSFFWTLLVVLEYFGVQTQASGWAQAIGTVGAVWAAVWTVWKQDARESERRIDEHLITAKALAEMALQAAHSVKKLNQKIKPNTRAPHEIAIVVNRLRGFEKIDLLRLPDRMMVDQVMIISVNLEYALQCADDVTNLIDPHAALQQLGLLEGIHMIVHGAWLNLRILQGKLEVGRHATTLER